MSFGYVESNEETSRELFYKKMVYLMTTQGYTYANLVDFNFAEKQLYGRVTRNFEPMVLSHSPISQLKNFSSVSESRNAPSALNFVVDAFEKLSQQFDKCALTGKISTTDTFLSSLKVHKAYLNPKRLYDEHLSKVNSGLSNSFKSATPKIRNFDEFVLNLVPALETTSKKIPFTFPAFVKSTNCPINVSGLAVEIADLEPDNDYEKIKQFIASPNWEFFVNACNSYGFIVDIKMPWRIVADVAGPAMLEYAGVYGLHTTDIILNVAYEKAHLSYFDRFKYILLNLYNTVKDLRIYEHQVCENGGIIARTITPTNYNLESFFLTYDDLYFLELYCKIRFFEEETQFSDGQKSRLINDCLNLAEIDLTQALNSFEKILNKTLDYSGAINYIIERRKLLAR
mgnify:CR=1 FL=1